MDESNDLSRILSAIAAGAKGSDEALLATVYEELRALARANMAKEPAGATLQPTALVNEAWLRLASPGASFENRAHFFGAAARAMRRILVERARARGRKKRGGGREKETLVDVAAETGSDAIDLVALDEALAKLETIDRRKSDVVHLRYFDGLSLEETADLLGVSLATVKSDWSFARAWLLREMSGE